MSTNRQSKPHSRVLLVDDDPEIHDLVNGILGIRNIEMLSAFNGIQAMEIALGERLDLILLDYHLPGANGIEVLNGMRSAGVSVSLPVIFITGNDNHKILTSCFQAGAADYIRKPFCLPELVARITSVIDRVQMLQQLEQQAYFDPLTHLLNRPSIRKRIQAAIESPSNYCAALLFLDFDRFKLVNDSLGHQIGDQLLSEIGKRLTATLRESDAICLFSEASAAARLGGDEFVVLLEDLRQPSDATLVANRLLEILAEPYFLSGQRICCNASIGIVNNIREYQTPDEVLRDADTAMYEAKFAGKGRYVLFDRTMHEQAAKRLRTENELRQAIANNEFELYYQPIVEIETGRCEALEALIRWNDPNQGIRGPSEFIPVAEETGLIVPIGVWVLDRACYDFLKLRSRFEGQALPRIHVNISRKHLLRDLVSHVAQVLNNYEISPECIHIEITENEIMQSLDAAKATILELKKLGVNVGLDDFGTGQSSLASLQQLPIEVLKIDRSFIASMGQSRSFAAVVHAIINLGQNMGMRVVAEGIETQEQLIMLQSMNCDSGQGYLFSKPMKLEQVEGYLMKSSRVS